MDVVRTSHRVRGDEQPLVTPPGSTSRPPHSTSPPTDMAAVHPNSRPHSSPYHGAHSNVTTTHFPSNIPPSSPARHSTPLTHSPVLSPSKGRSPRSDSPKRIASPHSVTSTPTRHSHHSPSSIPHSSPNRGGVGAMHSRYSHPMSSNGPRSAGDGVTLSPACHDTSKIIHEKNKSVTIVLGEQQVTYSTPDATPYSTPDTRATSIIKIADQVAPSSKLGSLTTINTTNDVDTLKSPAKLLQHHPNGAAVSNAAGDLGTTNPILGHHQRQTSYNSTAYTSNGGGTYGSSNGLIKSWHDAYGAGGLPEDGAEDWRRSTSTLVPSSKTAPKAGLVSWRGVSCALSGAALLLSAAALLRLPGLLLLYGPGTFIFVVLVCLVCVAAPLALLEAGLAQFSSCSVLAVWRLLPLARGVGWSLVLVCGVWAAVAAGAAAPWLHYFLVTTTPPGAIKGVEIGNCSWASVATPQQTLHYYRQCVYGTSADGGFGFNWPLPAGLLSLCFTAFVGAGGGTTLLGIISGLTALMALLGTVVQGGVAVWRLTALLSAAEPIFLLVAPFLQPNYDVLALPQVWLAGLGQALLMLGPGTALMLNHASHLPFRFPLRRHITLLTLLCLLLTLLVSSVTVLQMGLIRHEDHHTQPHAPFVAKRAIADPARNRVIPSLGAVSEGRLEDRLTTLPDAVARLELINTTEKPEGIDGGDDQIYTLPNSGDARLGDSHSIQKRSVQPDHYPSSSSTVDFVTSTTPERGFSNPSGGADAVGDSTSHPQSPSSPLRSLPSDPTLPVLSLMSPEVQTTAPVPAPEQDRRTESRPVDANVPDTTPTPASPTTCSEEPKTSVAATSQAPLLMSEVERPEDCILRIIKYGAEVSGPCSHEEVSVGAVFVLASFGLLQPHAPLPWLLPLLSGIVMFGVLCAGISSVSACLYVWGVAGKESGGVGVVVGAGAALVFTFAAGAPLVAQGGLQLLSMLDVGVLLPALVWPSILLTTAIAAAHGMNKLRKDFTFMIESKLSWVWVFLWAFLIPVALLGVFVWQCVYWWMEGYAYVVVDASPDTVDAVTNATGVPYSSNMLFSDVSSPVPVLWWQMAVVWLLRLVLVLPIPVVAVKVINAQLAYGIKDKLVSSLQSSREWGEWGPQDPIEHHQWRRWREDESRPFSSLESQLASRPLTYTHSTLSRNSSGGSSLARLRAKYQKKEPMVPAAATAL